MTILEKVARAIAVDQSGRDPFDQHAGVDGTWITEEAHKAHCDEWLVCATAAINAFLAAAAEQGWHMRPDKATEEMVRKAAETPKMQAVDGAMQLAQIHGWGPPAWNDWDDSPVADAYRAMLADPTAQFEWDE